MKILIIKLGAMGDVLRTTPLALAYRRKYPQCIIDWVVFPSCRDVLNLNTHIQQIYEYSPNIEHELKKNLYDIVINLDKDKEALDCMEYAQGKTKQGFGWNDAKSDLIAVNKASEYAVQLGIDDDLKFRKNQKTYQQISYEQAELEYSLDDYVFHITEDDRQYAENIFTRMSLDNLRHQPLIGLNTGSGARFAGKRLPIENLVKLIQQISSELKCKVLLLGGPEEIERNKELASKVGEMAADAGTEHTIHQFAAIVEKCDLILTGDTIAMHIAIATKSPVLAFFGSTCPAEIELYGRGKKIVSDIDCAPCYKKRCPIDEKCMSDFSAEQFIIEMKSLIESSNQSASSGNHA